MKGLTKNKLACAVLALSATFFFGSCATTFEPPPINAPVYDGQANITISEFRAEYLQIATSSEPVEITENYVIRAVVHRSLNIIAN